MQRRDTFTEEGGDTFAKEGGDMHKVDFDKLESVLCLLKTTCCICH